MWGDGSTVYPRSITAATRAEPGPVEIQCLPRKLCGHVPTITLPARSPIHNR